MPQHSPGPIYIQTYVHRYTHAWVSRKDFQVKKGEELRKFPNDAVPGLTLSARLQRHDLVRPLGKVLHSKMSLSPGSRASCYSINGLLRQETPAAGPSTEDDLHHHNHHPPSSLTLFGNSAGGETFEAGNCPLGLGHLSPKFGKTFSLNFPRLALELNWGQAGGRATKDSLSLKSNKCKLINVYLIRGGGGCNLIRLTISVRLLTQYACIYVFNYIIQFRIRIFYGYVFASGLRKVLERNSY
jgi:hypothetical protein